MLEMIQNKYCMQFDLKQMCMYLFISLLVLLLLALRNNRNVIGEFGLFFTLQ